MTAFDRVTFIIHTYNRPHFLVRLIRYFGSVEAMRSAHVIIADGSSDADAAPFDQWLAAHPAGFDLNVVRHPETTLMERLALALESIDTPFVILGADDDLYFFDWIETALALLDRDPTLGSVYGNFFEFELEEFAPFGDHITFPTIGLENTFLPWLEGERTIERLEEISKVSEFRTVGWYSLQRTGQAKEIFGIAHEFGLSHELASEKYYNIAHAAAAKTRMLPDIYLARQFNHDFTRPPMGFRDSQAEIEKIKRAAAAFIGRHTEIGEGAAKEAAEKALSSNLKHMRLIDRKRYFRAVADRLPILRRIWERLRPPSRLSHANPRLAPSPNADDFKWQQDIVRRVVRREAVEPGNRP